jgi:2-ketoarginine methyltransferase
VSEIDANFEFRLIEALQPFRGFALAQGIYHLFMSGIYRALAAGPVKVSDLAEKLGLERDRTIAYLRYLANEDVVALSGESASLTARGEQLAPFRPWYELLVGGYAMTFQQLGQALKGPGYASRDGRLVGVGSCGISAYDALPLICGLLGDLSKPPTRIVDLGCGDGTIVANLIERYPGAVGLGVDVCGPAEPSPGTIDFVRSSATDYARSLPQTGSVGEPSGEVFLAAFVLQEILEQEGRPAVADLLRQVLIHGAHFVVVEVDHRPADPEVMRHGLGLSYYNPYYLLHAITEQRLESEQFWLDLFAEAGAKVVSRRYVDPRADSTGLEFGYLLAPAGS